MAETHTDKTERNDAEHKRSCLGEGATTTGSLDIAGTPHPYRVTADWITLVDGDREPTASVFYTAYTLGEAVDPSRPVTFVFNGGPGAASAFLHLAAAGPVRVRFDDHGTTVAPPVQLVTNAESWLPNTDLVCVDPVGAGFSRAIPPKPTKKDEDRPTQPGDSKAKKAGEAFWEVSKDLDSLADFIRHYLSQESRWLSPVFLAGESYGGFRVARLAKLLQASHGIGLSGAILISPGLEFGSLIGSDYDLVHWIEMLPAMAATAHFHERAGEGRSFEEHVQAAEAFAEGDFLQLLVRGESLDGARRASIVESMAALIGLPPRIVDANIGRITRETFCRELLREKRRYIGMHDGSITGVDPFPNRETFTGPDPVIDGQGATFTMGINAHLRSSVGVKTELTYELLSWEAHMSWKNKEPHLFESELRAMDDLRYGMALNPHMKVMICFGYFDLVTPYYMGPRLVRLMKLTDEQKKQVQLQTYRGGHMFYTYTESRAELSAAIAALVSGS